MKVTLSKAVYKDMPKQVAEIVQAWSAKHKRKHIEVFNKPQLYIEDDSTYTLINLQTGVQKQERASGEWAGVTPLMCNQYLDLEPGIVAIEIARFMGKSYLTIYQGCGKELETKKV